MKSCFGKAAAEVGLDAGAGGFDPAVDALVAGLAILDGLHEAFEAIGVFASDGRLLLQRRSAKKDLFPGYYCASASGHVASGDDYLTTAERELAEELGISAPLTWIRKALIHSESETEITALYVAHSDGPYQFHPTETDGGVFLTVAEVTEGMLSEALRMTPALLVAIDELLRLARETPGGLPAFLAQLG